jgi:hypothetical protein
MGFSNEMTRTISIATGMTTTEDVPDAFGSEFYTNSVETSCDL